MKIGIFPDACLIIDTSAERHDVDEALKFPYPNAQWMPHRSGWDGCRHFYNADSQTFPPGFLQYLLKVAAQNKWSVRLVDCRKPRQYRLHIVSRPFGVPPRDYQVTVARKFLLNRLQIPITYQHQDGA